MRFDPISKAGRELEAWTKASRSRTPAVERSIRILALLETAPQRPFRLNEIARNLSIPKSSALNICATLVEGQLLRRSQKGYQLGPRLVQLGSNFVASVDVIREFYDVCTTVPVDLEALIQLAALDETLNAVFLARQDCNSGLRLGLRAEIGRRVPANCTAAGKALLAALPSRDLKSRLYGVRSLVTSTERSISSPAQLLSELETIRTRGYATDDEEVIPGLACVAAIVRATHLKDGLLAVSISAVKETLTPARSEKIRTTLFQLVETLQMRL